MLVEHIPGRMQWEGWRTQILLCQGTAPYLAFLCVITLVALGALPAVGELIIEQPFPIHLQQEEGVSSSPASQQNPPLAQQVLCSPADSQDEQFRCRYSTP